tara:strand:+ start:715796 stop:716080 length:285 start_codon:yes stop_codon:yes gene_type:complete
MKQRYKLIIISTFVLLFILIVSSSTQTRICTVCGVQDYETSIAGKTIEFLSQREYDEFNIHKKWQEKFGKKHEPHQWLLIEEKTKDIIKLIDSL